LLALKIKKFDKFIFLWSFWWRSERRQLPRRRSLRETACQVWRERFPLEPL